jgi:hypothetical protein
MSTRLALPHNLLEGRRPPRPRVDGQARSAILQLSQLTDRGECLEAAQQAVELLRADVYDLRLASVYLVGLFVERGVAHLPELLRCTRRLVLDEVAAPPSLRSAPRALDATLQWLFQAFSTHIQFHAQRRDETWTQWLHDGDCTLPAALGEEIDELSRVIGEAVEQPSSTGVLGRIGRWARGDLARALSTTAKETERAAEASAAMPEAKPEALAPEHDLREPDDQDHDQDHDDDDHDPYGDDHDDEDDCLALSGTLARPRPEPSDDRESPALSSLRHKLHGFEVLVQRGEFAKAAIIARDVQRIIEQFDPVEFLPSLFAGYFRAMNQRLNELSPHLGEADRTPWQVLSRFYQADLEGFLDE